MQICATKSYNHKEIHGIMAACPLCNKHDELEIKSSVQGNISKKGTESIHCNRCNLKLSFHFIMNDDNEIVDCYLLDYFKVGNMEFKNTDSKLTLYMNNTYVRHIDNNTVDLDKYKGIIILQ